MSRPDAPSGEAALAAFAEELRTLWALSGEPIRRLATKAHYSHPHLVRAVSGKTMPTWDVTQAFVQACGVSDPDVLAAWRSLWERTEASVRPPRPRRADTRHQLPNGGRGLINDPAAVGKLAGKEARLAGAGQPAGTSPARQRRSLLDDVSFAEEVDSATTREQFGELLWRLSQRAGYATLREIERESFAWTGSRTYRRREYFSRSTLSDWFRGRRLPNLSRLDALLLMLNASEEERHGFARLLARLESRRGR